MDQILIGYHGERDCRDIQFGALYQTQQQIKRTLVGRSADRVAAVWTECVLHARGDYNSGKLRAALAYRRQSLPCAGARTRRL